MPATPKTGASRRARSAGVEGTLKTTGKTRPVKRSATRNAGTIKPAAKGGSPARRQSSATNKGADAGSSLTDAISRALRDVLGQQKVGAEALAAALARSTPVTLKTLRDLLDRVLAIHPAEGLDEKLWGPAPSTGALKAAEAAAERSYEAALARVLSDALTREQAAARLGVSPQAVSKRTRANGLVAMRHGGQQWYPRWQFYDDGVVPELPRLIGHFPSTLALSTWVMTPFADLEGETPADMLRRRHGQQRVLELAEAASAAAW